jgi:sulfur-carrier protein
MLDANMKVRVELQSYLDQYAPGAASTFDYEAPDGATVREVTQKLGVPHELATVIVVNGSAITPDEALAEGDRLTLIPPIAGG